MEKIYVVLLVARGASTSDSYKDDDTGHTCIPQIRIIQIDRIFGSEEEAKVYLSTKKIPPKPKGWMKRGFVAKFHLWSMREGETILKDWGDGRCHAFPELDRLYPAYW